MNFRQDEEHQDILEMVHDFAVNEVKPLAAEIDRTEEFPMKNVKMMAEMGLMGIPFPEEYGGAGMDTLAYIQTVEELSKYCASTGVILSAHTSLCATPIYQFGSEEQKQKYLVPLAKGEKTAEVTLQEGRYHQIKRMFGCFGAKVVSLHRLAMGNLYLPVDLPEGACRELTAEELNRLQMHES